MDREQSSFFAKVLYVLFESLSRCIKILSAHFLFPRFVPKFVVFSTSCLWGVVIYRNPVNVCAVFSSWVLLSSECSYVPRINSDDPSTFDILLTIHRFLIR